MTTTEIIQVLFTGSIAQQLTVLRSFTPEMAASEIYSALLSNMTHPDDRVVFLSLDVLVKKYPTRVHQDEALLTPQLLALLTSGHGPIIDRAVWALSITGPGSVHTLLDFITQSTNDYQLEMGIWVLGRNAHLRQHATLVLQALRSYLHHPNLGVRYAALCSLMDMSPLRPFKRLSGVEQEFEQLYPELQTVAQFLLDTAPEIAGMAERYLELLESRYKPGISH